MRLIAASPLVLLVTVAFMPGALLAQGHERFGEKGVVELGGTLSFQNITPVLNGKTGSSWNYLNATPTVGFFLLNGLEVGANPLGVTYLSSGGSSSTQLDLMGFVAYNLMTTTEAVYPFVEGQAGYTAETDGTTSSGFTWAARGGVKIAIGKGGLLTIGVSYTQITLDLSGAKERSGSNVFAAVAGFGVWF